MNEAIILEKINAFWVFTKKGMVEALRLFPQYKTFIHDNQEKPFKQVEKELRSKIKEIKVATLKEIKAATK